MHVDLPLGASSQIIMVARLISSAKPDCLLIEQVDEASGVKGILNLECAVLPPGRMLLLCQM